VGWIEGGVSTFSVPDRSLSCNPQVTPLANFLKMPPLPFDYSVLPIASCSGHYTGLGKLDHEISSSVVFDSYYLCPVVIRACEARHFRYVGVAKKNRNFFPDGRPHDKRRLGA